MLKLTAKKEEWFKLPQDESGECRVKVLHLNSGRLAEIEEKVNPIVREFKDDSFVAVSPFSNVVRQQELTDASIVAWEGFNDEDGKPLECTRANKLLFLRNFDWFFEQIEEFRDNLREDCPSEEEVEKN